MFVVAECRRPKFLAGDFVRVQVDGRIFVLDDGGVVGELRLAQPVDPEVFLAVYHRETRGKVLCEEFVDDREGAVVVGVRLLDMRVERMVVDRRTVCERDQFVAYVDTAADHFQFFEMFESPLHGPLFGAQFRGVSFVGPAPFAF